MVDRGGMMRNLPSMQFTIKPLASLAYCFTMVLALAWPSYSQPPKLPETSPDKSRTFQVHAIGQVEKSTNRTAVVLEKKFQPGLVGLNEFSHVWVIWWFDQNDTPQRRAVLQVHPQGNPENPLTGVFATRSPVRPNLIALSLCKIKAVKENEVELEAIDALAGTPVLDLKPYAPGIDSAAGTGPGRGKNK
jgi:tRNA-Thr(GGU) m(6)t(6)A37 methyltransferase TsaA